MSACNRYTGTIGVVFAGANFTHSHGVTDISTSFRRNVMKFDEAEDVGAFNPLLFGALGPPTYTLAQAA